MLTLRQERPHVDVIVADPDRLDGTVDHYRPDLVVCNEVTRKVRDSVSCWVEILVHKNLDANVSIYGHPSKTDDIETEDLLSIVDEAERLLLQTT